MSSRTASSLARPERLADLIARARLDVDRGSLPSCQLAVAREGELIAFETFGAAPGRRYVTFSVTKAFVAAASWLLIGDGQLDPEVRVSEVVPEFGTNGKEAITIEQLLTHTAGIPRAPLGPPDWLDRAKRLERFSRWRLNWEPGTRCEYHPTSAHWVLAEVIERLGGREYRDFVRERLLEPLGLASARLGVPEAEQGDIERVVRVPGKPSPEELAAVGLAGLELPELEEASLLRFGEPETIELGVPGAGLVGTAADVALFYQALLHDPHHLWVPEVLADATSRVRVTLVDGMLGVPANRTLGLLVAGDDGFAMRRAFSATTSARAFGHPGAGGQVAWADPATGLSFCYLTNGLDGNLIREGRRRISVGNRAASLLDP